MRADVSDSYIYLSAASVSAACAANSKFFFLRIVIPIKTAIPANTTITAIKRRYDKKELKNAKRELENPIYKIGSFIIKLLKAY